MAQEAQWKIQEYMLQAVADALGPDLLTQMAFVGGCTTALLVTDDVVRDRTRATDDVDVMIHVLSMAGWYALQGTLRNRGFVQAAEDDVICRMRLPRHGLPALIVDFMPDDEKILGFGNRWYAEALHTAPGHLLPSGTRIRVVAPVHFLATKLDAWNGRGANNVLASRDIDDILTLIRGRAELRDELLRADASLRRHISQELQKLKRHPDFGYVVQSAVGGDVDSEQHLFVRFDALTP